MTRNVADSLYNQLVEKYGTQTVNKAAETMQNEDWLNDFRNLRRLRDMLSKSEDVFVTFSDTKDTVTEKVKKMLKPPTPTK